MKKLVITSFALIMMMSCTKQEKTNPFFSDYDTPFGVPPFEQIDTTHYMPAFEEGIKQHDAEIAAIIANQETPNFKNTIEAFDFSGELLKKVSLVFFSLTEAETNDGLQRIAKAVSPLLSEHSDNVSLNDSLFARIKTVYDNREKENLTAEQLKVLEEYYKDFVRSGALLSAADKEQLREINTELAKLSIEYGDNVLTETNAFELVIDKKEDLAGLPEGVIVAAAAEAKSRNKEGWIFTLDAPSRIPFLQYSDNRDLREKIYKGYINRSDNDNKNDNKAIVSKMVNLRLKKANLMGYKTFADFALDDRMAKTDENVNNLVNRVWSYAIPRAKEEAADMQEMIDAEGGNFKLAPWDWWYYAEKVRKAKYDLNEDELKPYFSLDNVREGAFMVANKLYGITFTELKNMPVYHPDVKVFEVKDENGKHLAVFYADYFPRAGKRAGAWMSNFRESYVKDGKEIRPVIYNVCNFTKPAGDVPSLLTIDEVQTLFHEFGHALHGMLTKCNYLRVSGTSVARDFVELPSQINEHWATAPEVLKMYAKHYQTGEIIPDSLIAKMENASKFNQGFATTEFLAAGILDMRWHEISEPQEFDVRAFERNVAKEIGLIDEITFRYRSTYFSHIFTNDYCAGYYSYVWAEVLDADAFDAFKEHGIFDPATAKSFRENILEKGGSEDPMAYIRN
ncbi:MAG: M3 family metallopeptidase [Barnesiella sp.]